MTHHFTFGQTLTLDLELPARASADEATLYLDVNNERTTSYPVPVEDGHAVYDRDLQVAPLPPFADVTYWWTYTTAEGRTHETERTPFRYLDNRYAWQAAGEGEVRVHWVSGETSRMVQALDTARVAMAEIDTALRPVFPDRVDIYMYPSEADLSTAMRLAGRTWARGVAYPELNVVLVAITPSDEAILAMQTDIPHELTHQALYNLLGPQGYGSLPTWLEEGLAIQFEQRPNPAYAGAVKQALAEDRLLPISELCVPFSEDYTAARLAYAQSASFVAYLRETYGWSGLQSLLSTYADGVACGSGTVRALGRELPELERDWQAWLAWADEPQTPLAAAWRGVQSFWRDAGAWIVLLSALMLPAVIAILFSRR